MVDVYINAFTPKLFLFFLLNSHTSSLKVKTGKYTAGKKERKSRNHIMRLLFFTFS